MVPWSNNSSPTATLDWNSNTTVTTSGTITLYTVRNSAYDITPTAEDIQYRQQRQTRRPVVYTNYVSAPRLVVAPTPPRRFVPYNGKLPEPRHRLEGARQGFQQMCRLPCYRGTRTR